MQLPLLRAGDLDDSEADPAEDFEIDPGVAADLGHAAEKKDTHVDATLNERPRDDEAVAAVVAPSAQDANLAGRQIVVRRLHRRHRLTAGVFHQHDRWDADLFCRPSIGIAHLSCVEHTHQKSSVLLVLDCGQLSQESESRSQKSDFLS